MATKIAKLLFLHHPHPINCDDLVTAFADYYHEPASINNMQQIEVIATQHRYLTLSENNLAARYQAPRTYPPIADVVHVLKMEQRHVYPYLYDSGLSANERLALIREKIDKHMHAYHPEGIFSNQLHDLFRNWIGVGFDKLDTTLQNEIRNGVFDTIDDPQSGCTDTIDASLLVMKGRRPRPQFPLKEPWKAYAFSIKYHIICVLHAASGVIFDRQAFLQEYRRVFGHPFDLNSAYNQKWVEQLIDPILYQQYNRFALGQRTKKINCEWIDWWRHNGPGDSGTYGRVEDDDSESDQMQNNDQNSRPHIHVPNVKGAGPHHPDTMVFIGGIPSEIKTSTDLLIKIEQEYHVKFANFKTPIIKRDSGGVGYISPTALQTAEMAMLLIDIHHIPLHDYPDAHINVKQWLPRTLRKRQPRFDND